MARSQGRHRVTRTHTGRPLQVFYVPYVHRRKSARCQRTGQCPTGQNLLPPTNPRKVLTPTTPITNLLLRRREKPTRTGFVYEVLRDGKVLLASLNPEFAACRLLASENVQGKARFWRERRAVHDIEFDIERAAKFTVRENEHTGPRFVKFKPFVAQADDVTKFAAAA